MLSAATTVPPVTFSPVNTLLITAALSRVTAAAPGPNAVASPVSEVI